MPFPDSPCDHCPRVARGLSMPCRAMVRGHARLCELAAQGHAGYIASLCDARPAFPPLLEQAGNLAGAVGRFVASGGELTTPEEQVRRLAICHECPEFSEGKCKLCGCVARWKTRLASEHCPDDPRRW